MVGSTAALGAASSPITINSGGTLDLNGRSLASANSLTINGSGVSGSGALINGSATSVNYQGAVLLGSTSVVGGTGNITFTSTIDSIASSAQSLTLYSGTQTISFVGAVGSINPLQSLVANGPVILNGNITTSGSAGQTYNGSVSLNAANNVTLNSGNGPVNIVGAVFSVTRCATTRKRLYLR